MDMSGYRVKQTTILLVLALAPVSLALALPLASQAVARKAEEPGPPLVKTKGVGRVSGTSVTLEGSIDPRQYTTTYYFEYGPSATSLKRTASGELKGGSLATEAKKVSETATGLQNEYYYRLVATNTAGGPVYGKFRQYTAKAKAIKPSKQKPKKSEFVLPKSFEPTPLGGTFVLSGTLTGADNTDRSIVLQASPYPYSAPFTDVGAPIVTNARSGAFSFSVPKLSTSTRFRVATVGAPPVYSLILDEQVTVRVTLKVRHSSRRGLVRLYGTVTPAEVGAKVFFQLETTAKPSQGNREGIAKPEKPEASERAAERAEERAEKPVFKSKFSTVVKRDTKHLSRFSAVVSVTDEGTYRAFVEVPPGPLASGHSQSIQLQAAAKKGKKKKKKKTTG